MIIDTLRKTEWKNGKYIKYVNFATNGIKCNTNKHCVTKLFKKITKIETYGNIMFIYLSEKPKFDIPIKYLKY